MKKAAGQPTYSLADFIKPGRTWVHDYMGAFAVTIQGARKHIERFAANMMNTIRSWCRS